MCQFCIQDLDDGPDVEGEEKVLTDEHVQLHGQLAGDAVGAEATLSAPENIALTVSNS